ncbi:hypothetical protein FACS189451_06580 [Bacteroidia bacterium]|nr:hypothetical protein FACS189446_2350 [Bacteroidia bacterium]GHT62378.1 hypothetical protein FACS189451_06580 [Bacteroidia bacterium]
MENSTYLPNSALKAEFEEFRKLKTTKEKDAFQKRIKAEFNKKTIEEQRAYMKASEMGLKAIGDRVEELIEKTELGEVANIISMAYLSQKYFGKTRHWLYQRLNGSIVNGKPAKFTTEEKVKLKQALQDIGHIMQNTSFKIA